MDISLTGQGTEFLLAVLTGVFLGIAQDVARIIRGRLHSAAVTTVLDLVYWLFSAVVAFWFAMGVGRGELRIFAGIGIVLGASVYFLTLSAYFRAAGFFIADGLTKIAVVVVSPFIGLWKRFRIISAYIEKKNRVWEAKREFTAIKKRALNRGEKSVEEEKEQPVFKDSGGGADNIRGSVPHRFAKQNK